MQDWKLLGTSFISHLSHLSEHLTSATGTFISRTSLPASFSKSSSSPGLEIKARMNPFRMSHQEESHCPVYGFFMHLTPLLPLFPFPLGYTRFWPRGEQSLELPIKPTPKRLSGKLKLLLTNIIRKICSGISKSPENDVNVTPVCLQTLQIPSDVLAAAWCLPQVSIFSNLVFG